MKSLIYFSILLSSMACTKKVALNETITLAYGETVNLSSEDLAIKFESINDSRCPLNVTCIWAGEARVTLKVSKNGTHETLELKTQGLCHDETGSCGETKELLGYRFQLLYVYPYPREGTTIELQDYSIKLLVSNL